MLLLLSMYYTHSPIFLQMNSQSTIHLYTGGKEIFLQTMELDVFFLAVERSILFQKIECDG